MRSMGAMDDAERLEPGTVEAAADAHADYVKFQAFRASSIVSGRAATARSCWGWA